MIKNSLNYILETVENDNFQILYKTVGFIVINSEITTYSFASGSLRRIKLPFDDLPFLNSTILVNSSDLSLIKKILKDIESIQPKPTTNLPIANILRNISYFSVASSIALFCSKNDRINYKEILDDVPNVCINIFKMGDDSVSCLEKMAFFTSGRVFKYSNFDEDILRSDITSLAYLKMYYDVNITLKVSDNIKKTVVIGSTLKDNVTFTHLNSMNGFSTVLFDLIIDGVSRLTKSIQFQIEFVDSFGIKKVRVLNHLFVSGTPTQVFSSLSFDTIFSSMVKKHLYMDFDLRRCLISMLVYYRNKCSNNNSHFQFVLPESVKCLPVLVQAFSKIGLTEKLRILSFNVEETLRYFYPRMFSLSEYAASMSLKGVPQLPLSVDSLSNEDIFILENSMFIFIYVPKGVYRMLVDRLFKRINSKIYISDTGTDESLILKKIVDEIEEHYLRKLEVRICVVGETKNEPEFLRFMVQDTINNYPDYIDYIFKLHFDIQKL